MRHAIVFLLLLSSALSFRIAQHRAHKKDGHQSSKNPGPESAAVPKQGEVEKTEPEDIAVAIPQSAEITEVESSQENIKDKTPGNEEEVGDQPTIEKKTDENSDATQEKGADNNEEGGEDINQDITNGDKEEGMENSSAENKEGIEDNAEDTKDIRSSKTDDTEDTGDDSDIDIDDTQDSKDKTEDPKQNEEDAEEIAQDILHKSKGKGKSSTSHKSPAADIRIRSNSSLYAFSAQLSSNVVLGSGSTMIFDNVLVNEGGLYFENSGQFACPDQGVYVFMWSVKHTGSSRGLTALFFGGVNIKSGPQTSYYSSSSGNGNSEMTAIVQCTTNPITAITVRSMYGSAPTYQSTYTSFSGFRLSPDAASAVAFTAELSSQVSLFPGGRIMFDQVVSNIGGHYDNSNGYFRCPDNGIYSFTVSTYYPKASNMWSVSKLVFDGITVVQAPVTHRSTTSYDSGSSSVSVLYQCLQGKDLYVEADKSYTFSYSDYGADLTSFSGFRLCAECNDLVAFSAVLSQNVTTSGTNIPFSYVLLSRGNAYNHGSGVFTCPDEAFYMFRWSGTSVYASYSLDLYVNGSRIKYNYLTYQSSSHSYGTSGTSSQSAVIQCSPGDTVSLRLSTSSSSRVLLSGLSTFSGYRLPGH